MQGKEFNKPLLAKELCLIFMPFVTVPIKNPNIADMTALKRQRRSLCFFALYREAWDVNKQK